MNQQEYQTMAAAAQFDVSEESTDLIRSISIENLLQQRGALLERFRQIQTLADEIRQLSAALHATYPPDFEWTYNGHRHALIDRYNNNGTETSMKDYRQAIDALAWKLLMKESGNLSLMDAKAREEWDEGLKKEVPELTPENIQATFTELHGSRQEMFNRGVINVFKNLSWDYKTNQPFKFGKRIIVRYLNGWYSHGTDKLDDLHRCLHILDGKPEPDHRQGFYFLISTAKQEHRDWLETLYLSLKWYKNGNGHITFKRLDLVEKMNKILHVHFPFALAQDNK